jgi:hypothetical protein
MAKHVGVTKYCDDDTFVNCNWVDTRWQYYCTHLNINNTQNNTMKQNTQNGMYITIRIYSTVGIVTFYRMDCPGIESQ